ncbi:Uncharacterized protein DAT39_010642, partial [Clarias magur]
DNVSRGKSTVWTTQCRNSLTGSKDVLKCISEHQSCLRLRSGLKRERKHLRWAAPLRPLCIARPLTSLSGCSILPLTAMMHMGIMVC